MSRWRVAVIGGSGFIGSVLVRRLLERGADVVIADKRPSERFPALWHRCDVRDSGALVDVLQGCGLVYNLAAEHRDDVRPASLYYDVNVDGARNVCQACEALDIKRLVFTSTVAVYGETGGTPATEDTPANPFNDYGRSKLEAEKIYVQWAEASSGRSLAILRPTVVFGEGNRGNVYELVRQIAAGRFVMVGAGKNRKSVAYVENVVEGLLALGDCDPGVRVFNYADKPDFDMTALVATVGVMVGRGGVAGGARIPYALALAIGRTLDAAAVLTGLEFPVSAVRVRKFCMETVIASDRLRDSGFEPPYELEEGLRRTVSAEFPECALNTGELRR